MCAITATVIFPLVYSPLKARRFAGACGLLAFSIDAAALGLQLRVDDIVAPAFSLHGIVATLTLATPAALEVSIAQAIVQGQEWRKLTLHCLQVRIENDEIACQQGVLNSGEKIALSFHYWPKRQRLDLTLQPTAGERWQAQLNWHKDALTASVEIQNGKITRLNAALPAPGIHFSQGVFDLSGKLEWEKAVLSRVDVTSTLRNAAFSDAAGTHASEKLGGTLKLQAARTAAWRWNARVDWHEGEIFWQPFYFAPGARSLSAQGSLTEQQASVEQAQLVWKGIGTANFNGIWDRPAGRIEQLQLSGNALALDGVYRSFLQPVAPAGPLRQLTLSGTADGRVSLKQGVLNEASLVIRQGTLQQAEKKFSASGIDANLAWHPSQARDNRIHVAGGTVGQLEIGAFSVNASVAAERIVLAPLRIPILDGALNVDGVEARRENNDWQWTLSAALQPIGMQRLSQALQLPTMHGTLSAIIPQVRYARQALQVDGALLFKVFDGTVVVKNLAASDLLSPAPHVYGNIDMRNLDLALLTQTFSFGSMQGRLDVTVSDLELFGSKPVRFDAKVASSAGDYPRKISQRAVENITALGGGGGVAAIQKSFLRFFDQFGYSSIGLSCHLTRGVCEMGGISEVPTGYVIVQGGGIPALTVIGYNRRVDWDELLVRLQRATQGGKPIVQ